jgi:HlyD family secretion protein
MGRSTAFVGMLTVAGLLAAIAGCHSRSQPEEESEAATATPSVPIVHPVRQTLTREIQQPGWIRAFEQTPIYSKISGYVQRVNVDIDQRVKEGDILLTLWVPEMEQDLKGKVARVTQATAEIKQAEQGLQAAGANVNTAAAIIKEAEAGVTKADQDVLRWEKEVARGEKLSKGNVFDLQTVEEAKNQWGQAKAGVAQAEAKVKSTTAALAESRAKYLKAEADLEAARARLQVAEADRDQSKAWLDYREIKAPYDGVITLRNIHRGHFLQQSSSGTTNKAAEPLFVLVREDLMRINAQVPEFDAVHVKVGMPAKVKFPRTNLPDYSASVTRTTWTLDDQTRTLRVEIDLRNPNSKELLLPGMFVNVVITVLVPDVLTVPSEALMNEGDGVYCYVIEGGKAVRTSVKVGMKSDRLTQVLRKQERHIGDPKNDKWEEFTGGEVIVARNPTSLIDGQAISAEGGQAGR